MAQKINQTLEGIAAVAASFHKKVSVFLFVCLLALTPLTVDLYSASSAWWWNLILLSLVLIPFLFWVFVWRVLEQLMAAPKLAARLLKEKDDQGKSIADSEDQSFRNTKPNNIRGVLSTINKIRKHEGLETLFDAISGITLICNPVFLILASILFLYLVGLILITPLILLI